MHRTPTALPEVFTIVPDRHRDDRGFFSESFRAEWFPYLVFIQDNHSHSVHPGTLRGLHFQVPPVEQAKLVRVARGRVRDVAVDLRRGSPTFLHSVSVELSAEGREQVFVPGDFAHGFVTLEPDTVVVYKVTNYHSQPHERGIAWDDPALGIDWGLEIEPFLSERDRRHPPFAVAESPFTYEVA